jgi:4-hydroxy-2-oxoheptanedioate aldolase
MLENPIKARWQADKVVLNGWLHIPSAFSAELMAHQGFDSITIDFQHGPFDLGDVLALIPVIQATGTAVIPRVPWNEPGTVMKVLDAGAEGLICPMINTRADCEAFIGACRYPPLGYRSYGPTRAAIHHGGSYTANANDFVLAMPMIESKQGLEHLDAILDVPGLDAVFVGPGDLGLDLYGQALIDRADSEFLKVLDRIAGAARSRGISAGIFTGSLEYAQRMVDLGFNFITIGSDARLLATAASATVNAFRAQANAAKVGY